MTNILLQGLAPTSLINTQTRPGWLGKLGNLGDTGRRRKRPR